MIKLHVGIGNKNVGEGAIELMKGKRISHQARDRLRQTDHRPRGFVPTVAVERAVLLDKTQAKDYKNRLHTELGKRIGKSFRGRYFVFSPEQFRLPVVESQAVVEGVQSTPKRLKACEVEETAYVLKDKLQTLLEGTPKKLPMQLGKLAFFDERHPRKPNRQREIVGVEPSGWRGPNAQYGRPSDAEQSSPLSLLVDESRLCVTTIAERLECLDPKAITEQPRVWLMGKNTGISQRDSRDITNGMSKVLPDKFELADPVIILRTSQSDIERIYVREPEL